MSVFPGAKVGPGSPIVGNRSPRPGRRNPAVVCRRPTINPEKSGPLANQVDLGTAAGAFAPAAAGKIGLPLDAREGRPHQDGRP